MKLGELFIDLNVNSGGAFNTLSGFAFKLTNIVNLAEKANDIVGKVFGNQAKWADDVLNTSKALNISTRQIQGLRYAAMGMGVEWQSLTGKLKKLDEEFVNSMILGKDKGGFIEKMSRFGLTSQDVANAKSSLDIMRKMVTNAQSINNPRIRNALLRTYGFDEKELRAWREYFRDSQKYDNASGVLTETELEKQRQLYLSMNKLSIATDTMWNKIEVSKVEIFKDLVDWLVKAEEKFATLITQSQSFSEIIKGLPSVFAESNGTLEKLQKIVDIFQKIGAGINATAAFIGVWASQSGGTNPVERYRKAKEAAMYAYDVSLGKEIEEEVKVSKNTSDYVQKIFNEIKDKELTFKKDDLNNYTGKTMGDIIQDNLDTFTNPVSVFDPNDDFDTTSGGYTSSDNRTYNVHINANNPLEAARAFERTGITGKTKAMTFVG